MKKLYAPVDHGKFQPSAFYQLPGGKETNVQDGE